MSKWTLVKKWTLMRKMDSSGQVNPNNVKVNFNDGPNKTKHVITRYGRQSMPPSRYNCN